MYQKDTTEIVNTLSDKVQFLKKQKKLSLFHFILLYNEITKIFDHFQSVFATIFISNAISFN